MARVAMGNLYTVHDLEENTVGIKGRNVKKTLGLVQDIRNSQGP